MAKPSGPQPQIGEFPIDTGTCELEPDSYSTNGWVLRINGVPSSHVVPGEPTRLDFEYMRWMAAMLRTHVSAHLDPTSLAHRHSGRVGEGRVGVDQPGGATTTADLAHGFADGLRKQALGVSLDGVRSQTGAPEGG